MKRAMIAATMSGCLCVAARGQPLGIGPGIMGGWMMMEPWNTGPGVMAGGHGLWALPLTNVQRERLAGIGREAARKQWELMAPMNDRGLRMRELCAADKRDGEALRKTCHAMAGIQNETFEASLRARKRIDDALTPQQRQQMRRGLGWR